MNNPLHKEQFSFLFLLFSTLGRCSDMPILSDAKGAKRESFISSCFTSGLDEIGPQLIVCFWVPSASVLQRG